MLALFKNATTLAQSVTVTLYLSLDFLDMFLDMSTLFQTPPCLCQKRHLHHGIQCYCKDPYSSAYGLQVILHNPVDI